MEQSGRRLSRTVDPFPDRLRKLQLDYFATRGRRHNLFRMGTSDSFRAIFHSALHVDRSVLRCRAISLSDGSGVVEFSKASRGSDYSRWNLLSASSTTVCVSPPTRRWMARRAFRLVSRHGLAAQSASVASRSPHPDSTKCLFSSHAWFCSGCDHDVVRSDGIIASSHISTSCDRHRRRFCSGRLLFLAFSGTRFLLASRLFRN